MLALFSPPVFYMMCATLSHARILYIEIFRMSRKISLFQYISAYCTVSHLFFPVFRKKYHRKKKSLSWYFSQLKYNYYLFYLYSLIHQSIFCIIWRIRYFCVICRIIIRIFFFQSICICPHTCCIGKHRMIRFLRSHITFFGV